MHKDKIKVLVVDDSAVVRQVLVQLLQRHADITVIGAVADPIFAMNRMNQSWPDVVILDLEMPRMDGITFLKELMAVRPTPVVVCSVFTEKEAEITMQVMSAGAIAIVTKPKVGLKNFFEEDAGDLVQAVRTAALTNMGRLKTLMMMNRSHVQQQTTALPKPRLMNFTTDRVVAIGISTGGIQALEMVLTRLSSVCPGLVIVQHLPEKFTGAFAARLNTLCGIEVREAQTGDRVISGRALIAPGGMHMIIKRNGTQYFVEVLDGPPVNRHKPSVDVLFNSVAKWAGKNALGIIMTGMGDDGARGLKEMLDAGAATVAQDENSCVVYGMPKEAVKLGAVQQTVALQNIASFIERF